MVYRGGEAGVAVDTEGRTFGEYVHSFVNRDYGAGSDQAVIVAALLRQHEQEIDHARGVVVDRNATICRLKEENEMLRGVYADFERFVLARMQEARVVLDIEHAAAAGRL
jgi:hypothetical protein